MLPLTALLRSSWQRLPGIWNVAGRVHNIKPPTRCCNTAVTGNCRFRNLYQQQDAVKGIISDAFNAAASRLQSMLPLSVSASLLLCRLATLLQLQPHIRMSTCRGLGGSQRDMQQQQQGQILRLLCFVCCSQQPKRQQPTHQAATYCEQPWAAAAQGGWRTALWSKIASSRCKWHRCWPA